MRAGGRITKHPLISRLIKVLLRPRKREKERKQYDFAFKMDVIEQVESCIPSNEAGFNNNHLSADRLKTRKKL